MIQASFQYRDKRGDFQPLLQLEDLGFTTFMNWLTCLNDTASDLYESAVGAMVEIRENCTDITLFCRKTDPDTVQVYADTIAQQLGFLNVQEYDQELDCIRMSKDYPITAVDPHLLMKAFAMDVDAIKEELDSR